MNLAAKLDARDVALEDMVVEAVAAVLDVEVVDMPLVAVLLDCWIL
jgi:hypothetical protein